MKTNRLARLSFILLIGTGVLLLFYGLYRYYQEPLDTSEVKAVAALQQQELAAILAERVDSTFNQYIEKAIIVQSKIVEVRFTNSIYSLMLEGDKKDTFIICEMQANQNDVMALYKKGDTVMIKGVFKGFLKDAVLLNCIFINDI